MPCKILLQSKTGLQIDCEIFQRGEAAEFSKWHKNLWPQSPKADPHTCQKLLEEGPILGVKAMTRMGIYVGFVVYSGQEWLDRGEHMFYDDKKFRDALRDLLSDGILFHKKLPEIIYLALLSAELKVLVPFRIWPSSDPNLYSMG